MFIIYFWITILIFLIQGNVLGQELAKMSLNQIKNYNNSYYGFSFNYWGELSTFKKNEIFVALRQSTTSGEPQSYLLVSADSLLYVDLPGTYGGRFYYGSNNNNQFMSNRYEVRKDTINDIVFMKEYWIVYGGMGVWDTVIHCYTIQGPIYYNLSLVHNFIYGMPGIVVNGKKITKKEFVNKALKAMKDKKNFYVKSLNLVLTNFTFH